MRSSRPPQAPDDDAESSRFREIVDQVPGEATDLKKTALGRGSDKKLEEV